MNIPDGNECEQKAVGGYQPTVKEVLDNNIRSARRRVEELCIKKAKLETLNMLEMPYFQVSDLFDMR